MATPTHTQQNILSKMQEKSIELLNTRETLVYLTQMWTNEAMTSLSDADIQTLTEFTGVTQAEALACKGSFDTILTALGDPSTAGTPAFRLLKLCNRIP